MEVQNRPSPMFNLGDTVRVVDSPFEQCKFVWIRSMDEYCGKEAVISSVRWSRAKGAYRYELSIDEWGHGWCEGCLEDPSAELEPADMDVSFLYQC